MDVYIDEDVFKNILIRILIIIIIFLSLKIALRKSDYKAASLPSVIMTESLSGTVL